MESKCYQINTINRNVLNTTPLLLNELEGTLWLMIKYRRKNMQKPPNRLSDRNNSWFKDENSLFTDLDYQSLFQKINLEYPIRIWIFGGCL
jgi:hypothetical protein